MPRTAQVTVYQFGELSDEAKERARAWWRDGGFDYEWWDATYDDAKQCFALLGFEISQIYFSGFSSQGDGACFEGTWSAGRVQPGKLLQHAPLDSELHRIAREIEGLAAEHPGAWLRVKHRGHYYHKMCTEFDVQFDDLAELAYGSPEWAARNDKLSGVEDALIELARDAMDWIYRALEKEHDYMNSDEQVDEVICINEYEFYADGKRACRV